MINEFRGKRLGYTNTVVGMGLYVLTLRPDPDWFGHLCPTIVRYDEDNPKERSEAYKEANWASNVSFGTSYLRTGKIRI